MSAMSLSGLAFALVFAAAAPEPDPTKPVVMTVPGMDRVRVRKNVVYERVGGEELLADVYLPPEGSKSMGTRPPVVVFQAGAYGLTASPTMFLGHPPPPEVLL